MRFQERDGLILLAVHEYGGVLATRHVKRLFWPDKSLRALQRRLSKLCQHAYLARPTKVDRRTQPLPVNTRSVYWLAWKGVLLPHGKKKLVAFSRGVKELAWGVDLPTVNYTQEVIT